MITKVTEFVKEHHMLEPGDTVVAGISGGADSVCLLFILQKLRTELGLKLAAVHVNHGIRQEAGEDAAYVERLCREWDVSFHCVEEDVSGYAADRGLSTEEAGRLLRYRAFEEALRQTGASGGKIAVAHNQNDSAETVLFHLMRGSALAGLAGIHPVRGNIIRPLLCVSRQEIEAFLRENGISYCIDRTNSEDTYTRNRIRHHILPYAEQEICSGAARHIYDTGVMIGEAWAYIQENAKQALCRCTVDAAGEDGILLAVEACRAENPFLCREMLLLAVERLAGSRKDISSVNIRALYQMLIREGNGRLDLPYGLTAYREYGQLRLVKNGALPEPFGEIAVTVPGVTCRADGLELHCSLFPREKAAEQNIPQKTYTKWFDYDKIIKSLVLRTRRPGDYLVTCRDGGKKSLKAWMIDEKIPGTQRERLPVLADGSHIIWIVGRRISEYYKIDERTKTVLQIRVTGGTSDGGED